MGNQETQMPTGDRFGKVNVVSIKFYSGRREKNGRKGCARKNGTFG